MKKLFLLFLAAFMPLVAMAYTVEFNGIYYNLVSKLKQAEVTSMPSGKYTGSVTIPESVTYKGTEYSVTSIGVIAFKGCTGLTSITIPNSVLSIGGSAFSDCRDLTSITIGNSVMSIGAYAFEGCTGLTSITIPNSVTSIDNGAFSGCRGLTSITIGNSVTSIGEYAFNGCTSLKKVIISDIAAWCGIKFSYETANPLCWAHHLYIDDNTEIKDLVIPNSITSIERFAFAGCSSLTSVTIPNSVTSIGGYAFLNSTGLASVTIPNSVTSIGGYAFEGCKGLNSVTIPNSVTAIGYGVFSGCTSLTSITIPTSVTAIGDGVFSGCTSLTFITISNSVTNIGSHSFSGCSGLKSVSIGCGVNNIEVCAFANCPELTDVYCLTESVPSTNSDAFKNSYIEYATLHVPAESVNAYKAADPWKNFKSIVSLDNGDSPEQTETQKCATPTISYANGKLTFASATEGAEFVTNISDADIKTHHGNEISLTATYNISVRATRAGYEDSETATATYSWNGIIPMMNGDVAKYRLSFIVNNKELSVRNVEVGTNITVPTTTDDEGNTITWYTYPSTMPAHDLVVYGMAVKPTPEPAPTKYTLTYMLDGQQYKQESIEEGATVAKETEPAKEGYTFSGWQNEPTTMPGRNVTVNGSFTINSYRLSFIAENKELSAKNLKYGSAITAPTADGEGNAITWYTYPSTMPAHDLVVYGMVVKQPEPEVFVWLTLKDGQGTTTLKVKQGTEQVLAITPEEGWKLLTVTMNGQDVTAQVKDGGTLTTPAIMQDATIAVVYEQEVPSEVAAARQSKANIKVVDDGVVISNAEADTRCAVYASNGQQVVSTMLDGGTRKITLPKGQVYVLTLGARTLKFAL